MLLLSGINNSSSVCCRLLRAASTCHRSVCTGAAVLSDSSSERSAAPAAAAAAQEGPAASTSHPGDAPSQAAAGITQPHGIDVQQQQPVLQQQLQQQQPKRQQQQQQQQPSASLHKQVLYELPPAGQPLPQLPRFLPLKPPQQPLHISEALKAVKRSAGRAGSTVEAHLRLKVDPRRGDQMVRGAAVLPHSWRTGLRIAVFAQGAAAEEARAAGADVVGAADLVASILESKGKSIDFATCLATPDMMPQLVKLGRILGPKGLMPNPKMGTLTDDIAGAVAELRQGRVEFKMDRTGIVHAPIGKAYFKPQALLHNMGALTGALLAVKPEAIKGGLAKYIRTAYLASTMGPSVPVDVASLSDAVSAAAEVQKGNSSGAVATA